MDRGAYRSSSPRVFLVTLFVGFLIGAPTVSADPGPVVSTYSGTCNVGGSYPYMEALVPSHAGEIFRFAAGAAPGHVDGHGFDGTDTVWGTSGYNGAYDEVDCPTTDIPFTFEYFNEPTAPVSFSGTTTPTDFLSAGSVLALRLPVPAQYVAQLTLTRGVVTIATDPGVDPQTFGSSGTYRMGYHAGPDPLDVTAPSGPQAVWTVQIHALPCVVPKLKGRRSLEKVIKLIEAHSCQLGKAHLLHPRFGKVRKQHPKAGAVRPPGTPVSFTAG